MIHIWPGLFGFLLLLNFSKGTEDELVAVVVRDGTEPSITELRDNVFRAITTGGAIKPTVYFIPGDWNVKGAWTLLPLFPKLLELHPNTTWILFMRESTRVDWARLADLTQLLDPDKEWFIGHELYDHEPTIVHHFAFHHDPSAFKYPHLEAGVLLSQPVVKRIGGKIAREGLPRDFAIDVQHELALYLTDGVNLTHSAAFCLRPGLNCATWGQPFQPCGAAVDSNELRFAVKTCSKFHGDRVPIVQRTWAKQTDKITFFSDLVDEKIPTTSLGVVNTDTGHCSKTMAIINYLAAEKSSAQWYVVADDDTILGVRQLREFLSCYNPARPILLGQKYGFASGQIYGYDYITGGGGMVLSRAAIQLIAGSESCRCPQPSTPDDMWLGACSESLGISIVHFPGFHQARPDDYPSALLQSQFVISFHKHWMIDPIQVFNHWFADDAALQRESSFSLDPASELLDGSRLFDSNSRNQLPDEL